MKKILICALLLLSQSAWAEAWLEMANQAGGKILLLSGKCRGKEEGRMVITTTPSGDNLGGCWYYFADMVHIVWDNGKTSSFNPNDFTYKESK